MLGHLCVRFRIRHGAYLCRSRRCYVKRWVCCVLSHPATINAIDRGIARLPARISSIVPNEPIHSPSVCVHTNHQPFNGNVSSIIFPHTVSLAHCRFSCIFTFIQACNDRSRIWTTSNENNYIFLKSISFVKIDFWNFSFGWNWRASVNWWFSDKDVSFAKVLWDSEICWNFVRYNWNDWIYEGEKSCFVRELSGLWHIVCFVNYSSLSIRQLRQWARVLNFYLNHKKEKYKC